MLPLSSGDRALARVKVAGNLGKAIGERLQKCGRAGIGYHVAIVDQVGPEANIGLPPMTKAPRLPRTCLRVLLRDRRTDRTWRGTGDPRGFSRPGILAVGPRTPIDRRSSERQELIGYARA